MEQEVNHYYREYTKGTMNRREFIKLSSSLAGGAALALSLLASEDASAQITDPADSRLETNELSYPTPIGNYKAYMARPKGAKKLPAVIVIHENTGLQPHIKDVARRIALEGFVALAPDVLSPFGGTPAEMEKTRPLFQQVNYDDAKAGFTAAVAYLKTNPLTTGKVGCTGFCWGGAMTNQVAVNAPDLLAAVPYYGGQPAADEVPRIKAEMVLHYAENDERINAGIPAFEEALKKAGVRYTLYRYPGAGHAFNNDTNPGRYHEASAKLAWERTIAFFKEKLAD